MKSFAISAVAFAACASCYRLPRASRASGNSTEGTNMIGVNIAGCDFGVSTDGSYSGGGSCPPSNYQAQLQHFAQQDNMNIFRLPVA